ncbi:hypothetical protein KCP75_23865 [Salmonella enterica subsp. enterica]|nr:hypothetical protein KCP75_23865 [Salmonella enterica subsp. enterica]
MSYFPTMRCRGAAKSSKGRRKCAVQLRHHPHSRARSSTGAILEVMTAPACQSAVMPPARQRRPVLRRTR